MKLTNLNTAHGQQFDPLIQFFKKHSQTTDIFCLQELFFSQNASYLPETKARTNIFQEIESRLPTFDSYKQLAPDTAKYFYQELLPDGVKPGIACFTKKGLKVSNTGGFVSYKGQVAGMDYGALLTGNCQWIETANSNGGKTTILHLHGLYQRNTEKQDTPARLKQSQIILDFLERIEGKKILCGDFNLLPDTESIKMIEGKMVNLVKEYNIESTRSKSYKGKSNFADYIFVSEDVKINGFKALPDQASDHLGLWLDFE